MKVNDIITEAPLGAGRIGRAISKRFGAARGDQISKDAIDQWAEQAKRIERGGTDLTPENYEQYLNAWLGKWLKLGRAYPGKLPNVAGANAGLVVNKFITQAVNQRMSGTIPGGAPELNASGRGSSEESQGQIKVKLVDVEPNLIIQFKNEEFVRIKPEGKDAWEWRRFPSEKPITQTANAFLEKQLDLMNDAGMIPRDAPENPASDGIRPNQVYVKGHGVLTKDDTNGKWRDEQGDVIVRPADIEVLDRQLTLRQQFPKS